MTNPIETAVAPFKSEAMTPDSFHLVLTAALKERSAREQRVARKLITLHARGFTIEQLARICHASGASPNNTDDLNAVWWISSIAKRVNRAHRASLISAAIAAINADRASRAA